MGHTTNGLIYSYYDPYSKPGIIVYNAFVVAVVDMAKTENTPDSGSNPVTSNLRGCYR